MNKAGKNTSHREVDFEDAKAQYQTHLLVCVFYLSIHSSLEAPKAGTFTVVRLKVGIPYIFVYILVC